MNFKKLNNTFAFVLFLNALVTYLLTIERKFSFWDVAEYIVSSAKLGVTHAPGAATFQLIGAVFSTFAFGNREYYSLIINGMSGLFSALTILFLYLTVTHLAKRILLSDSWDESLLTTAEKIIIVGSGLVGALIFTYSDTFWYSAVEGEVYSMSTLFTALLLWLICKWETELGKPRSDRWLILISLFIGLSVGVHLMSLLVVPSIVLIYFFRKNSFTWKNFLIANFAALAILFLVFKVIFPLTMTYFGKMEILLVNGFRMPFHSGTMFAFISLTVIIFILFKLTKKYLKPAFQTVLLSIVFMLIGLLTWLVIPIRANANPPVNLNNPDTAIGVLDYYNRVQYGEWPVLYGEMYTAFLEEGAISIEQGEAIYEKDTKKRKYVEVGERTKYKASGRHVGLFPKLYNADPNVMENYAKIVGYPEFKVNPDFDSESEREYVLEIYQDMLEKYNNNEITIEDYQKVKQISPKDKPILLLEKPSFFQNLAYFLDFQVGYMYVRYLMWNFTGKQNDWEGSKEVSKGNWISGIPFIDNARLGDQSLLPKMYKENKANNKYYFLPFILGLFGLFFFSKKDLGRSYALFVLFALTSFGIIMYTSVKPFEPRERDYAVVNSFYVFAIWAGLGVLGLFSLLKQKNNKVFSIGLVSVLTIVPVLMAFQNWDDHDRSKRETAYALAKNYLQDLDKNALIFVYGDNDTYPLWGLQETENYRDDVRVINFTLLSSPWNISQVKRRTYNAAPIPGKMKYSDYKLGVNDQILVLSKQSLINRINQAGSMHEDGIITTFQMQNILSLQKYLEMEEMSVEEAMAFLLSDTPQKKAFLSLFTNNPDEKELNFLPVSKFYLKVDKEAVLKNNIVAKEDVDSIVDTIKFNIATSTLYKGEITMLDALANYKWDRPIYFSAGGLYDNRNQLYLNDYLQYEGFVYKFVPILTKEDPYSYPAHLNLDVLKSRILNFDWGNLDRDDAYFDETSKRNIHNYMNSTTRCIEGLIDAGRNKEAKEMLDLIVKRIPIESYHYLLSWNLIASYLERLGYSTESNEIIQVKIDDLFGRFKYFQSLTLSQQNTLYSDIIKTRKDYVSLLKSMVGQYAVKGNVEKMKHLFIPIYKPLIKENKEYLKFLSQLEGQDFMNQQIVIRERLNLLVDMEAFAEKLEEGFSNNLDEGVKEEMIKFALQNAE